MASGRLVGKNLCYILQKRRQRRHDVAATLRGRFVEGEPAGEEETTGFDLEDVTIVEADPEEAADFDPEGETVNLAMPSVVSAKNWVGKDVEVSGHFERRGGDRRVLVVESIDEV